MAVANRAIGHCHEVLVLHTELKKKVLFNKAICGSAGSCTYIHSVAFSSFPDTIFFLLFFAFCAFFFFNCQTRPHCRACSHNNVNEFKQPVILTFALS